MAENWLGYDFLMEITLRKIALFVGICLLFSVGCTSPKFAPEGNAPKRVDPQWIQNVELAYGPQHSYRKDALPALHLPKTFGDLADFAKRQDPPVVIEFAPETASLRTKEIDWMAHTSAKDNTLQIGLGWPYEYKLVQEGAKYVVRPNK